MPPTHEVENQPPPLVDYDVFAHDAALVDGVTREGAGWAAIGLHDLGRLAGSREAVGWGFAANAHPPVLRTHDRYGHRIDEVEYHPAYHELMRTAVERGLHTRPWCDPRPGAHVARAAGFYVWSAGRVRPRLPDLDDVLGAARPAGLPRPGRRVGVPALLRHLRPGGPAGIAEGRRPRRHGDDREAGRLRRPGQHDPGRAAARDGGRVRAHRAQVVLLGADVRPVPRPRSGAGRADMLRRPPLAPGRRPQPVLHPAAEGQARQPLERVLRGRARTGVGPPGRRRGAGRGDDHRHGQPHPAGLRHRIGGGDAPGHHPGLPPHRPPLGLRSAGSPSSRS